MKPASLLAVLVFSVVALSHGLRVVLDVEVVIGGASIPMWASVVGLFVTAALAVALWREARPIPPPAHTA